MKEPNALAKQFARTLRAVRESRNRERVASETHDKLHVQTIGASLTYLYESLRNASENTGENLLLMQAIQRFFKRTYLTPDPKLSEVGEELITELTLAGYLENDSITIKTTDEISHLVRDYSHLRDKLLQKFPRKVADSWTLEPMSAAIEQKLRDHHQLNVVFADFAYNYFLGAINTTAIFGEKPASYEATLFVAVQQSLLHADPAAIRLSLTSRYQVPLGHAAEFAKFNVQVDQIMVSTALKRLTHLVERHGAPFRILLTKLTDEDLFLALESEKAFAGIFNRAVTESYISIKKEVNRGIFRSVVLLSVTRFLVFIATEVPYNLVNYNSERWLPLIINLFSPAVYMLALRLTLAMPGINNSRALNREITRILFEPVPDKPPIGRDGKRKFGAGYNVVYVIIFFSIFVGLGYLLVAFARFNWFDLVKFFLFLSMASFLGFRMSRKIRSIEIGDEAQNGVTMLRDLVYMPFVVMGRKINEIYSKFNIISNLLDMLIELPLKTILGFVRRWSAFLSAKKDDF